jgi:TonB-dependent starch-binding outer membrane protein SusC
MNFQVHDKGDFRKKSSPPTTNFYLKVMRLVSFLLLVCCLHVSARTTGQKVSLSVKNVAVQQVLQSIMRQTGVSIVYDENDLKDLKKISLSVKDAAIEDILNICLKNQPIDFYNDGGAFVIQKNTVVNSITPLFNDAVPPINMHGLVVNDKGEPVVGATISVKGGKKATSTDADGSFVMNGLDEQAVLIITGANIEEYEINIKGQSFLKITVQQKVSPLDQIQVIAYGTTTKRLSTGNVTTVKAEAIEKQPVNNVLQALQGLVPGLSIVQNTGVPGGSFKVRLRGENSFNNNDPLYIIDGVPYDGTLPSESINFTYTSVGALSALNFINPQDIESVSVLKDADATSIYGSRGSNGVILITTKKGKQGLMKFDANVYSGFTTVRQGVKTLNTEQYLEMRNEAFLNDGRSPGFADTDVNGIWDKDSYIDWQDVLKNNKATTTNAQASVSGGNQSIQYLFSGNYSRQTTGFPSVRSGQGGNQSASIHFNINGSSSNEKFKIGLTGSYLANKNAVQARDFTFTALQLPPNAPAIFNADGTLNWAPRSPGQIGTWINPYSRLQETAIGKTGNLTGNSTISYLIFPGLELKSSFGYTSLRSDEVVLAPASSVDPGYNILSGTSAFQNSKMQSWIAEPQISYLFKAGYNSFSFLLGSTFNEMNSATQISYASNFPSDAFLENIAAAGNISPRATNNQYKYNAVFSRLNYNYDDKYLLNANIRRDGSSRFGPGKQFHNFYSIGGAWIFTRSKLIEENLSFLSFGKLRGSYGSSGSDGIGNYKFLDLYQAINSFGLNPYQGAVGLFPANLYNADVAWEETRKLEAGAELGFFKDKIIVTTTYYRNQTGNQLVEAPVPTLTGFFTVQNNLPALIRNSGFEFSLQSTNIKTNHFQWSSSFNIALNRNKLVSFPGLEKSSVYKNGLVIGKPYSILKVYHFAGVNTTTGLYQFYTKDGELTSRPTPVVDNISIIDLNPKYFGGFQNQLRYKTVSLDFNFRFVKQMGKNVFGVYSFMAGTKNNQPVDVLDRWQKPGDVATYQRFSQTSFGATNAAYYAAGGSDRIYSDASFIRLTNANLSWSLPVKFIQKIHFKNCRIYVQGQNLLTITKYKGYDPETQVNVLPPVRVWTAGVQFSL